MKQQYLITKTDRPVANVTLHRPEVRNAMHIGMIRELTGAIRMLEADRGIRILRLGSSGPHFCSGADLNWMREGLRQPEDQLRSESLELAELFQNLYSTRLVVVTSVRGRAMGGAIGLVAASDIVVAEYGSRFAFSEAKLGLIPATIAPFVLRKLGLSRTRELMLSGRSFTGEDAHAYGLVHHLCPPDELEARTDQVLEELLQNGPGAMSGIKTMLERLESPAADHEIRQWTAELIALQRTSPEGQEGMNAYFEKRKPSWDETR